MHERDDAEYWIDQLDLEPHPEGGYYRRTHRSETELETEALPDRYADERATATSIYYLLERDDVSALHRLQSEELWHFHYGDPVTIHQLDEHGIESVTIGVEEFQVVVPRDTWFCAEVTPDTQQTRVSKAYGYTLVGCTVTPGFEFDDFELADTSVIDAYDDHGEWLERFLR